MRALPTAIRLCAAVSLSTATPSFAQKEDATPRTVIMTAFKPEWDSLVHSVRSPVEHRVNGISVFTGDLEGKPVLLIESGVSMVNASMNTQLVIDRFAVKRIVFSGIAGGVDPRLHIGDVVVPARWKEYLVVSFGRRTRSGWIAPDIGYADAGPNYGMIFPRKTWATNSTDGPALHRWFAADAYLLGLAKKVSTTVKLDRCALATTPPSTIPCLPQDPIVSVGGNGISGSAFADNAEYRKFLFKTLNAQVVDMESAAVVHVAYSNQVPVVIFRSLSDLAGGDAGANRMRAFMGVAAVNSAKVVRSLITALPD